MPGAFLLGSAHICWLTPHHRAALKPSEEAEALAPSVFNARWLGHEENDAGGFRSNIPARASRKLLQQRTHQDLHIQTDPRDWTALKGCRPPHLTHYHPFFHISVGSRLHHINTTALSFDRISFPFLFHNEMGTTVNMCTFQFGNVVEGKMSVEHCRMRWTMRTHRGKSRRRWYILLCFTLLIPCCRTIGTLSHI